MSASLPLVLYKPRGQTSYLYCAPWPDNPFGPNSNIISYTTPLSIHDINSRRVLRCHTALQKASLRDHWMLNSGWKTSTPVLLSELCDAAVYLNLAVTMINVPLYCLSWEHIFLLLFIFNGVMSTEALVNNQGCVTDDGTVQYLPV